MNESDPFLYDVAHDFPDHLRDESRRAGRADSISFPRTEQEVCRHLELAAGRGMSVTVQGARTGIAAGGVPEGGHVISLVRMKDLGRVLTTAGGGGAIVAGPGVLLSELRAYLAANASESAAFFPPDPTEPSASIGGMTACNASGARSFAYGPTRRYVRRLRVVLADGDVLELRRGEQRARGRQFELQTAGGRRICGKLPSYVMPAVKNAAGYYAADDMDMLDLFVGSEGTLGIVTEVELSTLPAPGAEWGLMAFFKDCEGALGMVRDLKKCDRRPVAVEFFDKGALALLAGQKEINPAFSKLPSMPAARGAAVYLEAHGAEEADVEASVEAWAGIMERHGADPDDAWLATARQELERLKDFRHAVPEAVNLKIDERRRAEPGITKLGTDLSVPDAALDRMMALYRSSLEEEGLEYVIFGHIGNNHLHVNIIPASLREYEKGRQICMEWAREAVRLGGTVSAEHGIGKLKTHLLRLMYGDRGIEEMREVKRLFDPHFRLNPGVLFPAE